MTTEYIKEYSKPQIISCVKRRTTSGMGCPEYSMKHQQVTCRC